MKSISKTTRLAALFFGIGMTLTFAVGAATIRVPQDQPTITAGVAAAQEGDTVLVSDGTYQEHDITITKAITLTSVNGNAVTTIDGQGLARVLNVNSASGNWATISGFSIINGNVGASGAGGNAILRTAGYLQISSCIFSNNYCNGGNVGSTVYVDPTKLKVTDCVLKNNNGENFAGIYGATVVRCLLYNNGSAGANNPCVLGQCNSTNCTVYGNTGGVLGNAWTTGGMSGGTAVNCIFWGNSGHNGQQVDQTTAATITYSIVQSGFAGTGNLTTDPQFVNAASGNFNLSPNSPAIDAGDPTTPNDPDGSRADIGALPFLYPVVGLAYAVKPTFNHLWVGTNYQLQVSTNLNGTFTNWGSVFTATNNSMVYTQYFDVANWNQLFFRLQKTP